MPSVTDGFFGNPGKKAMSAAEKLMGDVNDLVNKLSTAVSEMEAQVDKNNGIITGINEENAMLEGASKSAGIFKSNMMLLSRGKLMIEED